MKKLALLLVGSCLLITETSLAQSTNQNYVETISPRIPTSTEVEVMNLSADQQTHEIDYFDGIGRLTQQNLISGSASSNDIVNAKVYDGLGREEKTYLPFTVSGLEGEFLENALDVQATYYQSTSNVAHSNRPYSEWIFESSLRSRTKEMFPPGLAHTPGNGHALEFIERLNLESEVPRLLESNGILTLNGYYSHNQLIVTEKIDENGISSLEYSTIDGRLVMSVDGGAIGATTYFMYDVFGNQTTIIPPLAYHQYLTNTNPAEIDSELLFRYSYDQKNRLTTLKVPGRGIEYIIYNQLNQLILNQTAVQRQENEWSFYKYDILGRMVYSGLYDSEIYEGGGGVVQSWASLIQSVANQTSLWEEKKSGSYAIEGYSNQCFPTTAIEVLKVHYFDGYDIDANGTGDYSYVSSNYVPPTLGYEGGNLAPTDYARSATIHLEELATVTKVRILDDQNADEWLSTAYFYDDYGRLIQKQYNDFVHLDIQSLENTYYNFAGDVIATDKFRYKDSPSQIRIQQRFDYDHASRLILEVMQVDNQTAVIIKELRYNEIGEIIEKNLHSANGSDYLQSVDYRYNIKGLLTHINNCDLSNDNIIIADGENSAKVLQSIVLDKLVVEIKKSTEDDDKIDVTVKDDKTLNVTDTTTGVDESINSKESKESAILKKEETLLIAEVEAYLAMDSQAQQDYLATLPSEELTNFESALKIEKERLAFEELSTLDGDSLVLDFSSFIIPEGSSTLEAITLAGQILTDQLNAKGITDAATIKLLKDEVASYLVNNVGSVYFNDDDNDLWGACISYDNVKDPSISTPLYDGAITETIWKSRSDEVKRKYSYEYDELYRLKEADYRARNESLSTWSAELGYFSVSAIAYDLNGNIKRLNRKGRILSPNDIFNFIDKLNYSYQANQLLKVDDIATSIGYGGTDFGDVSAPIDYLYDANGNMTRDENKIMTLIYNHLDLIKSVTFDSGDRIDFIYDADGTKLAKVSTASDGNINLSQYSAELQFNTDGLEFIQTSEGRVIPINTGFQFEYNIKDHLGSFRVGFSDLNNDGILDLETEVLQVESYYPFGMKHEGIQTPQVGPENLYNYTGKEDQMDFGLNLIDYGARMYDPAITRWLSLDPLAADYASWSPYNYVFGNPIMFIDPDGRSPVEGWVEETNDEGKKSLIYDKDVNTVEEAENAGYKNVSNVHESATVSANDGSYSYSLNEDGTVQDVSDGSSVETRTTTEGGTIINVGDEPAIAYLNSDEIKGPIAGTLDVGPGRFLKNGKKVKNVIDYMKGGKKAVRDRNFGIVDKKFWKAWEKAKQKMPGKGRQKDIKSSQQAKDAYNKWKNGEGF